MTEKHVKSSAARRRPRWAGYVVMLLALVAFGGVYTLVTNGVDKESSPFMGTAVAESATLNENDIEEGQRIFNQNCASCHGLNAEGTNNGPSLIGVGAAAVDFQMSTGRMPLENPYGANPAAGTPDFSDEKIRHVAAYVASLAPGPAIPTKDELAYEDADVALGGDIFRSNCAQCHNFAGSGGALTNGRQAPDLRESTPRQIYEAMETGPNVMPAFPDNSLSPEEKRAVIKFVKTTQEEANPGGFGLGRIGPVSEGLVSWVVGLGIIIAVAMWITARHHE
jgi:ubiquinol-cytochrome c reductase cytochrome c subunit